MSKPRIPRIFLAVGFSALFLSSCLSTGVKTLGPKSSETVTTPATDADSFAISLAVRDTTSSDATTLRTVTLQGNLTLASASLVKVCGDKGLSCACKFFTSSTDASPITSVTVGISSSNNSFSCVMPASATPASYTLVQLYNTSNPNQATGQLTIKALSSLTLDDVLSSSMSKQKVVGVYQYACTRTFFEGEGVSASNIVCTPSQRLGVISATYNFYTYRSGVASNSGGGDFPFSGPICNRNSFLKIQCTNSTPSLRYGFYAEAVAPFLVGVQMTRAPEAVKGDNVPLVSVYGYAALPDNAGNCPVGLIKIRQWQAQPASIIQGMYGSNPPSSFINQGNNLSNTVVEASAPANFVVTRQPNQTPCAGSGSSTPGDCTNATFGGTTVAQSVSYTALTPIVCVIPPNLLSGLF